MNSGDGKPSDFWSRRKAAVRKADEEEAKREEAAAEAERQAALEEKTDAEILEELGLPDPDTLGKDDDFAAFLVKAVPERLRRRALRRLWLSNPVLANLDGLNDYEEDFTDAATAGQVVRTAYEVGRGFLKKVSEEGAAETPDVKAEGAEELCSGQQNIAALQQENSAATQNIYDENGKTSIQLTQSDDEVQSNGDETIDSGGNALVDSFEERLSKRRRLRFDYD